MAINQLTTANTFQEWLIATSSLVATANALTDHSPGQILSANTILDINGSDARINVRTTGSINVFYSNTAVLANANIASANITNLIISKNVATLNVTSNLYVGGDTVITGNLVIGGNTTLDAVGFNDLSIAGRMSVGTYLDVSNSVNVTSNITTGNVNLTGVVSGATQFVGAANTQIYTTINAAIDSSIAFAIALG